MHLMLSVYMAVFGPSSASSNTVVKIFDIVIFLGINWTSSESLIVYRLKPEKL